VLVGVGHESDFTIADFAADRRAPTPTAAAELATPSRAEIAANLAQCLRSLSREMRRRLQYAAQALDGCTRRLVHPAERLRRSAERVTQLRTRLAFALGHRVHRCESHLHRLQASLAGLDPEAVLARGYSITRTPSGEVLRDASQAREGDEILTTLGRGALRSKVKRRELL
jgi:exodeoxyribonuclease VII large subunit